MGTSANIIVKDEKTDTWFVSWVFSDGYPEGFYSNIAPEFSTKRSALRLAKGDLTEEERNYCEYYDLADKSLSFKSIKSLIAGLNKLTRDYEYVFIPGSGWVWFEHSRIASYFSENIIPMDSFVKNEVDSMGDWFGDGSIKEILEFYEPGEDVYEFLTALKSPNEFFKVMKDKVLTDLKYTDDDYQYFYLDFFKKNMKERKDLIETIRQAVLLEFKFRKQKSRKQKMKEALYNEPNSLKESNKKFLNNEGVGMRSALYLAKELVKKNKNFRWILNIIGKNSSIKELEEVLSHAGYSSEFDKLRNKYPFLCGDDF